MKTIIFITLLCIPALAQHYYISMGFAGNNSKFGVPVKVRAIPQYGQELNLSYDKLPDSREFSDNVVFNLGAGILPTSWSEFGILVEFVGFQDNFRLQRNQFGTSDRGVGTSLRYYEVKEQTLFSLGACASLSTPWWHGLRLRGTGILDMTGYYRKYESGYDMYNEDTVWKKTSHTLRTHKIRMGIDYGSENSYYIYLMYQMMFYNGYAENSIALGMTAIINSK